MMDKDKEWKPLTREEALNDKSSLSAPSVFVVTHKNGTKTKILISNGEIKTKELKEDED